MSEKNENIVELEHFIELLIEKHQNAVTSLSKKDEENRILRQQLVEKENELIVAKETMLNIQHENQNDSKSQHVLKQQINELVREVDQCLALLSK